jgi:hypothetical protein
MSGGGDYTGTLLFDVPKPEADPQSNEDGEDSHGKQTAQAFVFRNCHVALSVRL